jgi:hypothetical protein
MAEIPKAGTPSLVSQTPPHGHRIPFEDYGAGELLEAGDACCVRSNGKVYRSTGAADNANANVHGFVQTRTPAGRELSLYFNERMYYGENLTPGAAYYLSATVPGGLSDTPPFSGAPIIAFAIDTQRIVIRQGVIH